MSLWSLKMGKSMPENVVIADFSGQIKNAVNDAVRVTSGQLKYLAKALSEDRIPPNAIRKVHYDVGLKAQRSLVNAYTHRKGRRRGVPSGYRQTANNPRNVRFAGGKLLQ